MSNALSGLIAEIKRCEAANATIAAVAMVYVGIDAMSFLALPAGRERQERADFIAWVDAYMKAHPDQPYQYRGIDVYGARCALLHNYGSEATFHQQNTQVKTFGYHDGGKHAFDSRVSSDMVIIATGSLLNDFIHAVQAFLVAVQADPELRARVEARLPKVLETFPVKA
jgi:hypothetical protein